MPTQKGIISKQIFTVKMAFNYELWNGREEMACDEAELGEEEFAEKKSYQQNLQQQVIFSTLWWTFVVLIHVHC